MVKKEDPATLFYVSIGLLILSSLFLLISLSTCIALTRRRRNTYCANCRQIIKLENIILKKGLGAVSHDSLLRVKRAISSTLTENPEYTPAPDFTNISSNNVSRVVRGASNPQYAPLEAYTTMISSASEGSVADNKTFGDLPGPGLPARSKESVVRVHPGKGNGFNKPEYEYMRSPRFSRKVGSYVNVKNSCVSLHSSKSVA